MFLAFAFETELFWVGGVEGELVDGESREGVFLGGEKESENENTHTCTHTYKKTFPC